MTPLPNTVVEPSESGPNFIRNPFSEPLWASIRLLFSDWSSAFVVAPMLVTPLKLALLATLAVLWPYGLFVVVLDFIGKLVLVSAHQIKGQKTHIEAAPYVITTGVYVVLWTVFALPSAPLLIIGGVGRITLALAGVKYGKGIEARDSRPFIENPFSGPLRRVFGHFYKLRWSYRNVLPSLIAAPAIFVVLAVLAVLWPYGYLIVIVSFLGNRVLLAGRDFLRQSTLLESVPYMIVTGVFSLLWFLFAVPCSPFLLIGRIFTS